MSSIHEVAKQAGVSTATVSRTFNTPGLLNAQTHQRVLEVAHRLDYRPNRGRARKSGGQPAAGKTTGTQEAFIGFQFFAQTPTDLLQSNAFYAPILAGAQSEAASTNLHLMLHTTDRHQMTQGLPKMVSEQAIAGMLLVGTADPEILTAFLEHVPQIVLVDNRDATGKHDCIVSDGLGGILEATRYLFELGHQRLGFLLDDMQVVTFQDRLRGFVCAHFERGLSVQPSQIISSGPEDDIRVRIREFLLSPDRPTALVVANDMLALEVMQACRELGVRIPEELSLVGFDDIEFSAQFWPPLTTVRVNKDLMGRLAVSRLQMRLQAEDNSLEAIPPITLEVPVSLIERQSCRRLSSSRH